VTVRINLVYVLVAIVAVIAAAIASEAPDLRRYLKMETM
jgi:hypothetical protein